MGRLLDGDLPRQLALHGANSYFSSDGTVLRPDGSHIAMDPYGPIVAEKVLQSVLTAAG